MELKRSAGPREVLIRLTIVVASLSVGAAIAEIVFKIFMGRRPTPEIYVPAGYGNNFVFLFKPHARGEATNTWAEFNNQGMRRATDVADEPSPGTFRILSYGDSVAFGFGLSEAETYTYRLENLLNDAGAGRFEALNMARGSSPSVQLVHMSADIPRLRPKMVVLEIELTNDVSDEVLVHFGGRKPDGVPSEILNARYIVSWDRKLLYNGYPILGPYFKNTYNYAAGNRIVGEIRNLIYPDAMRQLDSSGYFYHRRFDASFLTRQALDSAFDQMFRSIQAAHSLSNSHGAEFLVLLVPSKYLLYPNPHSVVTAAITSRAEARLIADGISYLPVLSALATSGLSPDELYFDFCHPKAIAQEIIAKAIAERIAARRK